MLTRTTDIRYEIIDALLNGNETIQDIYNYLSKRHSKKEIRYWLNILISKDEKIVRNEDKRTSVLIKGIPSDMPKKEIRSLIEKYGNLNYLYITKDLESFEEKATSVAFINVINSFDNYFRTSHFRFNIFFFAK